MSDQVWSKTMQDGFLNCKYFSKLTHRHRREGWQEVRPKRKTDISSQGLCP